MKYLEPLVAMRKKGKRPDAPVFVFIGHLENNRWERYGYAPSSCVEGSRIDFRPITGMDVCLYCEKYDETASKIFSEMQKYARTIVFTPFNWEGEGLVFKNNEVTPL